MLKKLEYNIVIARGVPPIDNDLKKNILKKRFFSIKILTSSFSHAGHYTMKTLFSWRNIVLICLIFIFAIFFKSDCDLFIALCPFDENSGFRGKVVWITGASGGIGASLAHNFVKAGAEVIISARRESLLNEVADNCSSYGNRPAVYPLDVTDKEEQELVYKSIIQKYGGVDILILNAGRSQRSLAIDTPVIETEKLFNLNFISYLSLTKLVLPDMIRNGGGQVCL